MKAIVSNIPQEQLMDELELTMDPSSNFALVEHGHPLVENAINISFDGSDIPSAKRLLVQSGYYKMQHVHHLIGKLNGDAHIVPLSDILYIEGINNDTFIYTKEDSYSTKDKLYQLEEKLSQHKFIRVSKSYIVSVYHINKIRTTFQGKLLLMLPGNIQLEVTRHYVKSFKDMLGM